MESNRKRLTAAALTVSAMLMFAPAAHGGGLAEASVADLERGFWMCDYLGTTRGVTSAPMELCGAIMDAIQVRKFDSDYEQMLEWWRQNKVVEHAKLEAADRSSQTMPSSF